MINSGFSNFLGAMERRLLPQRTVRALQVSREIRALSALERRECAVSALRRADHPSVKDWLAAHLADEWQQVSRKMADIRFGGESGAVNPGDRRALYYLARALRPHSILEVGTHVGASTSMLALALRQCQLTSPDLKPRLVTVDISEVNDDVHGAWRRIKCSHSPAAVMGAIGCQEFVKFVTSPSIPYLRGCKERFDLIFLDGDHTATAVYQEIPAALRLLNQDGVILLHDYFPELKPLWSDGQVVPGPALAVQRLHGEGALIVAQPLGGLPWPTKLGSNFSSLALLGRRE